MSTTNLNNTTYVPYLNANTLLALNTLKQIINTDPAAYYDINITGIAAGGAPPIGAAGGDLTGFYPNPQIANLAVTNAMLAGSITASKLVGTDIDIVGTVTTGTWNATPISPSFIDYNTTNLQITTGQLNTIQDIDTSASPTFNGLTLSGLTPSELVVTDGSSNLSNGNLSGDLTTSGLVATLATVNSDTGTFGDGTHVSQVTVNEKGLMTGVSSVVITGLGNVNITDDNTTNATVYPVWVASNSGSQPVYVSSDYFKFNPLAQSITLGDISDSYIFMQTYGSDSYLHINRHITTNHAVIAFDLGGFSSWGVGNQADGTTDLTFYDNANNQAQFTITQGSGASGTATFAGTINSGALTVSQLIATDSSKNLVSGNLSGDVTSSAFTTTLATVNTDVGSYGDAAHTTTTTANAKGLITAISTNSIQITESQVTNLTSDLSSKLNLSGGTMTGNLILNGPPSSSLQAATKNYVDMTASGLQIIEAVVASSTANLVGSYNNGTSGVGATFTLTATGVLTLDGQTVTLGDRYLIQFQSTGYQNGVYDCTTAGAIGVSAVFTRSSDFDTPADMDAGVLIPVILGTSYGDSIWLQSATITNVGVDALVFSQFASGPVDLVGDVTGSGFAPTSTTVVKINGASLGTTTATSGNLLIGSGTAWVTNAMSGDATISSSGALTVGANKITYAKFQQVSASSLLGNPTGSLANVSEITLGVSLAFSSTTINTIQNIRTSDSPTFIGLTVNSVTSAASTDFNLTTGAPASNVNANNINLTGHNGAGSTSSNGGGINLTGGNGLGSSGGNGGSISLLGGNSTNGSTAGAVTIQGGVSTTAGGIVTVQGGTGSGSSSGGGQLNLIGGTAPGLGTGGEVAITGGSASTSGTGGDVIITGGASGTTSTAGNLRLRGGLATSGTQGAVIFDQGKVNLNLLSASSLTGTDSSKNLVTGALTGDVTTSAFAATIAANAVTYSKFQQVAASSLIGNPTGSLANASGITLGTSLTFSGTTLNTIQGITTSSSPRFAGLTLGSAPSSNSVLLNLEGTDSNISGPHIAAFTSTDLNYPVFQQLNWTHNNIALNFDSFFNGSNWISSYSGSNFQIYKISNQLQFNFDSGITAGSTLTWSTAGYIDTSGNLNWNQRILANTQQAGASGYPDIYSHCNTGQPIPSYVGFGFSGASQAGIYVCGIQQNRYTFVLFDLWNGGGGETDFNNIYFYAQNTNTITYNTTRVSIPLSTASTSTTTGALVVSGGLGVGGAAYISGAINNANLSASSLVSTDSSKNLVSGALTGDVTTSAFAATIAANSVTYAKFQQVAAVSLVGNPTGSLANASGITLGVSLSFSGSAINTIQNIRTTDTPQFADLGLGAAYNAATITSQLNIFSATQASSRIILSGQEFYQASNTSADGVGLILGVNRSTNRQLWIIDSALSASSASNPVLRLAPGAGSGGGIIDCLATDGTTILPLKVGNAGALLNLVGSSVTSAAVLYPTTDNSFTLGKSGNRWSQLWAGTTTINTSDASTKNSIAKTRLGLDFINKLTAREFKFNERKRFHHGLVAHEVKKVLDSLQIDSNDFAGYVDPRIEDENDDSPCGLRYSEFIAPLIMAVQELSDAIKNIGRY